MGAAFIGRSAASTVAELRTINDTDVSNFFIGIPPSSKYLAKLSTYVDKHATPTTQSLSPKSLSLSQTKKSFLINTLYVTKSALMFVEFLSRWVKANLPRQR
jgi:hypothetical protein